MQFVDEEKNKNKFSGAEAEKQNQKTQQKPNKQIELNWEIKKESYDIIIFTNIEYEDIIMWFVCVCVFFHICYWEYTHVSCKRKYFTKKKRIKSVFIIIVSNLCELFWFVT